MARRGAPRALAAAWSLAAIAWPAAGRELWSEGESSLALRSSAKASLVVSRAPGDPDLFPERESAASLWRLRFDLDARPGPSWAAAVAYEHRLRVVSGGAGLAGGGSVLPVEAPAAWRARPLDWGLLTAPGAAWRHEVDRAFVAWRASGAEVVLGRQAVGWGRGVLFGAVDLFAPFSPLEADREWRRGVDAVRAEVRLGGRLSLDAVAVLGERLERSALAARLRGYAGQVDGELVLGWRARDLLAGLTSSAAVGDAAVHAELAAFRTPGRWPGGLGGDGRLVLKAVAGASYRFAVGSGLPVFAEWHLSGFGAADPRDALARLLDPAFRERYLRGDTQILGRQALALLASYEASPELALGFTALASPRDGSGVATPGATLRLADGLAVRASLYLPWGAPPAGPALRSEYGAVPFSGFLQVAVYD